MKEKVEAHYVRRTQKDYSMSFKFQVVGEVERGEFTIGGAARKYGVQNPSTVTNWLRKFGTFDWHTQTPSVMKRTPEQTIFELEQKVELLEKQKVRVSMTQHGDPLENAIAERVNGILKEEFELEQCALNTAVLRKTVRQTVDIYNNLRPHLSCALLTPTQMHGQAELPRTTYHKKIRSKQTLAPNNKITMFT